MHRRRSTPRSPAQSESRANPHPHASRQGFDQDTIKPKPNLPTGTPISPQASVIFDINAAIKTNTVVNTIDNTVPPSRVNALPATVTSTSFAVSWSGSDGNDDGHATPGGLPLVRTTGRPTPSARAVGALSVQGKLSESPRAGRK
jgi:hypothetical protein